MSVHVWLVGRPISLSARLAGTTCLSCLPPPSAGGSRYGYHLGPGVSAGTCGQVQRGVRTGLDRVVNGGDRGLAWLDSHIASWAHCGIAPPPRPGLTDSDSSTVGLPPRSV